MHNKVLFPVGRSVCHNVHFIANNLRKWKGKKSIINLSIYLGLVKRDTADDIGESLSNMFDGDKPLEVMLYEN